MRGTSNVYMTMVDFATCRPPDALTMRPINAGCEPWHVSSGFASRARFANRTQGGGLATGASTHEFRRAEIAERKIRGPGRARDGVKGSGCLKPDRRSLFRVMSTCRVDMTLFGRVMRGPNVYSNAVGDGRET